MGDGVGVGVVSVSFGRRAAARAFDTVMLAVLSTGVLAVAFAIAVVGDVFSSGFSIYSDPERDARVARSWSGLSMIGLLLVAAFEPWMLKGGGRSLGKDLFGLTVVGDDSESCGSRPGFGAAAMRWAVVHVPGVVVGFGVWTALEGDVGTQIRSAASLGCAVAVCTLICLTAVLDPDGRGWPDKLAGTTVITAPSDDSAVVIAESDAGKPTSTGVLLGWSRPVTVLMVLLVTAAVAFVVSSGVYLAAAFYGSLGSEGVDKYDDDIRGTNTVTSTARFGQRIGVDGDGCWPENGKVFCDLVSIGGLHWDAGDVKVERSNDILIGSGNLCLKDVDGAPWCWEWSTDMSPRPALVPDGVVFLKIVGEVYEIEGDPGAVCGQTPDYREIVCWTVGVDQTEYRQAVHRVPEGDGWVLRHVDGDPPFFSGNARGSGRSERFDAFTGQYRGAWGSSPSISLRTETSTTP